MHIPDGVLSPAVLGTGAALAAGGVAVGLATVDSERIPKVAVLSSAFFVASLAAVPVGPTSIHPLLGGLMGVILGWAAFPAVVIALLLQALFFGHGGLTTLGVNTVNMAAPAVVCYYLFGGAIRRTTTPRRAAILGSAAGALAAAMGVALLAAALVASGREFAKLAILLSLAHLVLIVAEGALSGSIIAFLFRVRPEILELRPTSRSCRSSRRIACFVVGLCAFATTAAPAQAHKLKIFATASEKTISGYAYLGRGARPQHVTVEVLGPAGETLGETRTDDTGEFTFQATVRCDHTFIVDTGDGHRASYTVRADELPANLPAGADTNTPTDETRRLLAEAVAEAVNPLRRQLDAHEERLRLRDILGGIGYIVGVMGLLYYLKARRA